MVLSQAPCLELLCLYKDIKSLKTTYNTELRNIQSVVREIMVDLESKDLLAL